MYKAIIGKVHLVPIPNANTLQLAIYNGLTFAVDKSLTDDKLYLIFPPDGQLSKEYAEANDLIRRRDPETGTQCGGFFESNRKVRSIKLMKGAVISVGFIADLSTLSFTKGNINTLKEGDEISEFNGVPICNKYINEATLKMKGPANQPKKKRDYAKIIGFAEHQDTSQFYRAADSLIASGDLLTITLKLDGTSVRIGNPYYEKFGNIFNNLLKISSKHYNKFTIGTRRVNLVDSKNRLDLKLWPLSFKNIKHSVLALFRFLKNKSKTNSNPNPGYYNDSHSMYKEAGEPLRELLLPGETVYGEIVGWVDEQRPLFKRGGMTFKYGVAPGKRDFYVYNIKHTYPNGYTYSLPWNLIKWRAVELGVKTVPDLLFQEVVPEFSTEGEKDLWFSEFKNKIENLAKGADPIDPSHIREGVVVRVDKADTGSTHFLKCKSAEYYALEDKSKSDEGFVDLEEIQS